MTDDRMALQSLVENTSDAELLRECARRCQLDNHAHFLSNGSPTEMMLNSCIAFDGVDDQFLRLPASTAAACELLMKPVQFPP